MRSIKVRGRTLARVVHSFLESKRERERSSLRRGNICRARACIPRKLPIMGFKAADNREINPYSTDLRRPYNNKCGYKMRSTTT
jgi:hypothetical protein